MKSQSASEIAAEIGSKSVEHNQKGLKGAGVKGAGVANCRIFRSAVPSSVVVWSILLVSLSGVKKEKVMTIYDAGPLAAGPLCGLLTLAI